ncbi:hypothetical protein Clacol_002112 [Clathrus columnatus]|uniref:Uncharacterized protein n=1 Tax=Clathrus columnatus TaxID=1419009 RepID=A0AAV4ZZU8_9AGAM|nr:hypothetical protein Clacol_002112 [Clathrus columnatus]
MIKHNRANIDEPPTALGQLVPWSAYKKKNEKNPTTTRNVLPPPPNPLMFPQAVPHMIPPSGYPFSGMPFGTPYPMMPVPYFPPTSLYNLPKVPAPAQTGNQSNPTSPSNNPTSDDFDFEDPRDFPDVQTWFMEHDICFANIKDV